MNDVEFVNYRDQYDVEDYPGMDEDYCKNNRVFKTNRSAFES